MKEAWTIAISSSLDSQARNSVLELLKNFMVLKLCQGTSKLNAHELCIVSNCAIVSKFVKLSCEIYGEIISLVSDTLNGVKSEEAEDLTETVRLGVQLLQNRTEKRKFDKHVLVISDSQNMDSIQNYLRIHSLSSFKILSSLEEIKEYSEMLESTPKGPVKNSTNKFRANPAEQFLEMSPFVKFPVQVFSRTLPGKLASLSKLSLPALKEKHAFDTVETLNELASDELDKDFCKVQREILTFQSGNENDDEEVVEDEKEYLDRERIVNGYVFGDEIVPLSDETLKQHSFHPQPCIKILQIVKSHCVDSQYDMSAVDILCFNQVEMMPGCNALSFSQVVMSMMKKDCVALARVVLSQTSQYAKLCKLVPCFKFGDEEETDLTRVLERLEKGHESGFGIFVMVQLPTAHHMREFRMDKVDGDAQDIGQEEVEQLATALEKHKMPNSFDPSKESNPAFESFYKKCLDTTLT